MQKEHQFQMETERKNSNDCMLKANLNWTQVSEKILSVLISFFFCT